ncbi:hypothetical protein KW797_00770 [Candidatus Parcubacteria bacterium]|nr:hypothetical protein [Candidatus Parcubacteria bacterium]
MEGNSPAPAPVPAPASQPQIPRVSFARPAPVARGGLLSWKAYLIAVAFMVVFLIAFSALLMWWYDRAAQSAVETFQETLVASDDKSLGNDIYQLSVNPLGDTLPESEAPVANPLDDAYQNPFQ